MSIFNIYVNKKIKNSNEIKEELEVLNPGSDLDLDLGKEVALLLKDLRCDDISYQINFSNENNIGIITNNGSIIFTEENYPYIYNKVFQDCGLEEIEENSSKIWNDIVDSYFSINEECFNGKFRNYFEQFKNKIKNMRGTPQNINEQIDKLARQYVENLDTGSDIIIEHYI